MPITPLPALDRTSSTFRDDVDQFFGTELPAFSVEAEAARVEINTASTAATNAATTAGTHATNASNSATTATTAATTATNKASEASTFRNEAETFKNAAEAAAAAASGAAAFTDTNAIVKGSADATKLVRMEVDGLTTGTTRVLTIQDKNLTVAGTDVQQAYTKPQRPSLSGETAPSSNAVTWDLTSDSVFRINLNASITTFNLTGTLAQLAGYQYRVNVRFNGGSAITWPASVKWAAGTAPTLTGTSGKVDSFTFEVMTTDGTNYYLCEIGRSQNVG